MGFGRGNICNLMKKKNTMKYSRSMLVLAGLIAALPEFFAQAQDAPSTAGELLKRFETAFQAKNIDAMMELFNWQGVSEDMKAMQKKIIGTEFSYQVKSVTLSPLPADFTLEFERNGIRYLPNVAVAGVIDIQYVQKGNSLRMPYGKMNNAFYLAGTTQERISQPETIEKSLNISVHGTLSPDPAAFEGFFVYLKGGKEIKEDIKDEWRKGNLSHAFWGDRIKSCKVWKTSTGGKIRLVITEDGKDVFKSDWETTNNPIEFKAKF
jgi:hypothetical protein